MPIMAGIITLAFGIFVVVNIHDHPGPKDYNEKMCEIVKIERLKALDFKVYCKDGRVFENE